MKPSIIEGPRMHKIYSANVPERSPPRAAGDRSCQIKKVRGSVWDRLGKPHEVNDETVDARAIDIVEKDQEVYDQHTLSVPVSIEELCGSIKNGVHELDKSCCGNRPGECTKPKQAMRTICKLHAANNILQKRHFGEINSCPSSRSDSLMGGGNMDHQHKESPHDFKRLNSTSEATAPTLVTKVQDVKQRMWQIEMAMSKLRTKQLEMKKDGQPHVLTNSGVINHSEEVVESRTVFVTNVHFAATKEALSFHFAKCGLVLNVVILTDLNAQPKGSAYVIFANKESIDKAMALSGTSFFSRTLKVTRKAEKTPVTASIPQLSVKPTRTQLSQVNRADKPFYLSSHLQWQRKPVSAPSEPLATITQMEAACDPVSAPSELSSSIARVEAINSAASHQ
ncbi:Polyadenylate-binding protein [Actinidia chinensis var. chinensis]|uniref:Polyadenylate-binding protein n=1 Tax=Actinidia chinensis var. chinensis TaxID=1590841 RepID=A0A2R6QPD6_ACTCC|nr:Polyadenylate-binding protein [Actinidia chinensis var. chinensis]